MRKALKKFIGAGMTASMILTVLPAGTVQAYDKTSTVNMIGNAHIDAAWNWRYSETIKDIIPDTFNRALSLMDANPNYRFTASSSQLYQWAQEYYPDMAAKIAEKVKNGQWEIVGGQVVEPDLNNTDGESMVRQSLLAQNYFRDTYGTMPKVAYVPDVFGFGYNMPQFFKKSGMDYFVTTKLNWNDTNKWPYEYFNWTAPDGSTVTSYKPTNDYVFGDVTQDRVLNTLAYPTSQGLTSSLVLYGSGDHGGGPNQTEISRINQFDSNPANPNVKMNTTINVFKDLEQQVKDKNIKVPNVDNELYFENHRGVSTTSDPIKKYNRYSEEAAEQAEIYSSVGELLGAVSYPQQKINEAWQRTLLNQFHDVLPGSAIAPVYNDAFNDAEIALNKLNSAKNTALNGIASRIKTQGEGQPIVLYNSLTWERTEVVQADVALTSAGKPVAILDASGKEVPSQILSSSGSRAVVAFEAAVPAMGYAVYRALEKDSAGLSTTIKVDESSGSFENQFFKVTIDKETGNISSIYDKKNSKEVVDAGKQFNELQFLEDTPREWEAWNVDYDDMTAAPKVANTVTKPVSLVENGPAKATFKVSKVSPSGLSTIDQYITIYNNTDRIDVQLKINWQEKQKMLKAAFPMSIHPENVTYDIAYATISRPAVNTQSQFEVVGYRFADMSKDGYGVSVLSDSKSGWDCPEGVLRMSLLRSPTDNRGGASDIGNRDIKYSFYPHSGDWKEAEVALKSYQYNYPITAFAASNHEGDLPALASFAKVSSADNNVVMPTLKKAEVRGIDQKNGEDRSRSYIVRLVETEGKDNSSVKVTLPASITEAKEVNLIEDVITGAASPEISGNSFTTSLNKYEIKTFLIKLDNSAMFKETTPQSKPVDLAACYNIDGMSYDANRKDGNYNGNGETYSADLMPDKVVNEDVTFNLGSKADGKNNIVQAEGQTIEVANAGKHQYLFMLGSSTSGIGIGEFKVNYTDGTSAMRTFSFAGWKDIVGYAQNTYIKDTIGLHLTHTHMPDGNTFDIDNNMYVYKMALDAEKTVKSITLPNVKAIKLAAITLVDGNVLISTDQQAPSKVNNLTASGAKQYYNTAINLSWEAASDNTGVSNYFIYRATKEDFSDAKLLVSTTDTNYTDTDFAGISKYYYAVCAQDNSGNIGALSEKVSAFAGANIALLKPTKADGEMNSNEAANLINDGNTATKWCYNNSRADVHWNVIDLETERTIDGFKLYHAGAGGESAEWNTRDYKILVSSDNNSWTEVVTRSGNKDSITEDLLSAPVKGRYVKLEVTKPTNSNDVAARIYEFQVYGDDADFPKAVPEAPQIGSIVQNNTSVTLNLNFAKDTESVDVKYGTEPGVYGSTITALKKNTVTIDNLIIGKAYYFSVVPRNILGEGKASEEISYKMLQSKSSSMDLSAYFDLDGASTPDKPKEGMFDGVGWAYDGNAIPSVIENGNIRFKLGSMTGTDKNIVSGLGQTITLPQEASAQTIYLLEAGANGTHTGTIKVNYADGTSDSKNLTFTDWCQGPGTNEKVAYSIDHRISNNSGIVGPATNLFSQPITVDSSKKILSITLPNMSGAKIFAISLVSLADPDTLSHNASLSSIKAGDTLIASFDKNTFEYNVPLPAATKVLPKVTVATEDPNAYAFVTQAGKFPGSSTINVVAEDGLTRAAYKINFKVMLGSAALTVNNVKLERNNTSSATVTAKLDNGDAIDIKETKVEFLTTNSAVAAVNSNTGVITAGNVGTAEIYAKVTLDGITVESNRIAVTVDTSIISVEKLLNGYIADKEVVGPLVPQLSNSLRQAKFFSDSSKASQAIQHMEDFVKLLNNAPMDSRVSDKAKEVLNLDAKALIAKWSN